MRAKAVPGIVLALLAMSASPAYALIEPPRATATQTTNSDAARLLSLHNQARAQHGVAPLRWSSSLASMALQRAQQMASAHRIWHDYGIGHRFPPGHSVGENVGVSDSADNVFAAFMSSPAHRFNILLGVYDQVGIASVQSDDGNRYFEVIFLSPVLDRNDRPVASRAAGVTAKHAPAPDHEITLLVQLVQMDAH